MASPSKSPAGKPNAPGRRVSAVKTCDPHVLQNERCRLEVGLNTDSPLALFMTT